MEKTKVCISGLGGISQIVHLPILSKMDEVEIVGVCDSDKTKSKSIAHKYNVKNFYTNHEKMIDESGADCVFIATPTNFHKAHTIKALEKGMDVFVEKPLAINFAQANEIVQAAKKNNRRLMVGMNTRFRPDIMMQESFISAGELGEIFYVKTGFLKKRSTVENWSVKKESGGGVIMDLGIVLVDIALWLMKFPNIKSVSAVSYNHIFKTVEDSAFAFLRFENGSTISIEASWSLLREEDLFYCNVYGQEGSASINPLKILKRMHGTLVNVTPVKIEKPSNVFKRSYEYEFQHFINSIRNSTALLSSGDEALLRMKIIDAIYKSAKTRKEVSFK